MSLFAVQLAENDGMVLVVDAAVVMATDGWWVFRNADDQPVATLPKAAVCAIDALDAVPDRTAPVSRRRRSPAAGGGSGAWGVSPASGRPMPA